MNLIIAFFAASFLGFLGIRFLNKREHEATEYFEQIAQTHYYELLENINHLHYGLENFERLEALKHMISVYQQIYPNLKSTKKRVQRLWDDFYLKEKELTKTV